MKSYKYIEFILKRKSFPDFIKAVNFKADMKEWTECIAMFFRILHIIKDKKIDIAFDIGSGKRPTLGAIISLNIKSINKVVCIDPQLDLSLGKNIKGLTLEKETLLNYVDKNKSSKFNDVLICCNHSHVSKKEIYQLMDLCNNWTYITSPCCIDNKLTDGLYYKDRHIWSPKNEIFTFIGE